MALKGDGVIVAQLGAREHYSVPRMCHAAGLLARLHTDFWLPSWSATWAEHIGVPAVRRLAGRRAPDIPRTLVRTHWLPAACRRLQSATIRGRAAQYRVHAGWGRQFARGVARDLAHSDFSTFFGFSSASLEALHAARRTGALAVLDEIAPTHEEEAILADERRAFPGWEPTSGSGLPAEFLARLEAEWAAADRIVVNSCWTKQALAVQGVPASKLFVVPLTFEATPGFGRVRERQAGADLRVLWLGTLCLRKGLPYALEAARLLARDPVKFTFAGPIEVDPRQVAWPDTARYVGPVARVDVGKLWHSHDLFILPTLSDGFGLTQVEAMAHGLPVVATPCCGEVVEDGRSGLLVAPRDARSLADAIRRFIDREIDLEVASRHALGRAQAYSPQAIWPRWREILRRPDSDRKPNRNERGMAIGAQG